MTYVQQDLFGNPTVGSTSWRLKQLDQEANNAPQRTKQATELQKLQPQPEEDPR